MKVIVSYTKRRMHPNEQLFAERDNPYKINRKNCDNSKISQFRLRVVSANNIR